MKSPVGWTALLFLVWDQERNQLEIRLVVIYKTAVSLDRSERDTILGWLEYFRDDSYHYGGAALVNPDERAIVRSLEETPLEQRCVFTDEQASLMRGWMEKAISRRYGSAQYVTPAEQSAYDKISAFVDAP
jgi:hypothetical protein